MFQVGQKVWDKITKSTFYIICDAYDKRLDYRLRNYLGDVRIERDADELIPILRWTPVGNNVYEAKHNDMKFVLDKQQLYLVTGEVTQLTRKIHEAELLRLLSL